MQIIRTSRDLGKSGVATLHKTFQKRIASFHVTDPGKTQFLGPTVLQGAVGTFYAALGLRGIGTQDLNVKLRQGTAKLDHASTAVDLSIGYLKHTVLVRIKRHRATMFI